MNQRNRIATFQNDEGAAPLGGGACSGQLVSTRVKEPSKLTFMRCHDACIDDCAVEL
jgi:hypothetical protein